MMISVLRNLWLVAAATLALLLPASPAMAQDETARFTHRGVEYELPIPEGFCIPTGVAAIAAQRGARLDPANTTLLHLSSCSDPLREYIIIKVPASAPPFPLPRERALDLLSSELERQFGTGEIQRGVDDAGDVIREGTGGLVETSGASQSYGGRDDACIYVEGFSRVSSPEGTVKVIYASCLAPLSNEIFSIHSYGLLDDGAELATLRVRSRMIAGTIAPR